MRNNGKVTGEKSNTVTEKADQCRRIVARNWYVISETDTELHLVHKGTGKSRKIKEEAKSYDKRGKQKIS